MTRTIWIITAVAIVLIGIYFVVQLASPPPAVNIETPNAKVSIGQGGVSISVAPSEP